jgi:hypothetical protein
MNKTMSLVLCFVMVFGAFNLSGCVTAQDKGDDGPTKEESEKKFWSSPVGIGVIVLGVVVVVGAIYLVYGKGIGLAEAEEPDDGIRMVSSENEDAVDETSKESITDILQHIQVDVNQNNDVFVGFHFSY